MLGTALALGFRVWGFGGLGFRLLGCGGFGFWGIRVWGFGRLGFRVGFFSSLHLLETKLRKST